MTAFADLLEALLPELRAYARNLCRDPVLADDLVQEACLKAWAARETYDPSVPLRPWAFRILRNLYFQQGRRTWRESPLEPEDAETALIAPDNAEAACDFSMLQRALSHLPETQRAALIAVMAAGLSYDEAGALLGCAEGTVKSRVNRGREALLGLLNGAGTEPLPAGRDTIPAAADLGGLVASLRPAA
jgi:RNA polymerase sigma-70 factor (ECF subfamily)